MPGRAIRGTRSRSLGNLGALDGSVNTSLGPQIDAQIRNLQTGTKICGVSIEDFLATFPSDGGTAEPFSDPRLAQLDGFNELVGLGAGTSFGNGIVRIHSEREVLRASRFVRESFPEYGNSAVPVAKDWLGRQFAVPLAAGAPRPDLLLLIEPGSGEVFEIDCGVVDLFNAEMVADPVTYLASDLFEAWREANPVILSSDQCVGFKVPLFLGGAGSVGNLEVSDESVYWSLFGQMRLQGRIPPS